MPTVKQQMKSKTNVVITVSGAILAVLPVFGIDLGTEGTAAIMTAITVIMRQFTNEPLSDK
jgi:hypothetical protein